MSRKNKSPDFETLFADSVIVSVLGAAAFYGVGLPNHELSPGELKANAVAAARASMAGRQTLEARYEAQFLDGKAIEIESSGGGKGGVLNFLTKEHKKYGYGQSVLAGTSWDTESRSESSSNNYAPPFLAVPHDPRVSVFPAPNPNYNSGGDVTIPARAILHPTGPSSFTVTPISRSDPNIGRSLNFTVDSAGQLIPSNTTVQVLEELGANMQGVPLDPYESSAANETHSNPQTSLGVIGHSILPHAR